MRARIAVFALFAVLDPSGITTSSAIVAAEPDTLQTVQFDPYQSIDSYQSSVVQTAMPVTAAASRWKLYLLPDGLIYRPYLAGPKESRTSFQFINSQSDGLRVDSTIGGQWGLLRYGTPGPFFPLGVQFDLEASFQSRQTNLALLDILSSDIRVGFPLSFSHGRHKTKLAFYFLRSHPSDRLLEWLSSLNTDDFFQRQSLVLGHSIYFTERFRLYGEAGYAVRSRVSDQWEFQFGAEYAPGRQTNCLGFPFLAANGYLREEVNYSGTLTLQAGWAWRNRRSRLLRIGLHYANGMSNQFALHDKHEQQIGIGIWQDF